MELPPPISGDELERRLKEKIVQVPLADGFLYKGASLMISSQPAVGKSVLSIQAAYQLSLGLPLFGALPVYKPLRIWYLQMERSELESLERLQIMRGDLDVPLSNLFIDVELQAMNFLNREHFEYILKRGKTIQPDLIIIDPLYGIAIGLSKDEIGATVAKLLTILKKELGCTLWINHHTVKNPYDIIEGQKVQRDDPFYGAQWLKAHVTGSYLAESYEDGVKLSCKKDSHGLLLKEIITCFDHDTYLSSMISTNLETWERYKLLLNSMYINGKRTFFFEDVRKQLGCAVTTLRELHRTPRFRNAILVTTGSGHKTLYTITMPL